MQKTGVDHRSCSAEARTSHRELDLIADAADALRSASLPDSVTPHTPTRGSAHPGDE